MSVERWTLIGIPADTPVAEATAEDYVFSGTTEFSHEMESELMERIVGKKKDWNQGVVEETINITFNYDREIKGDQALLESVKNGKQMRFWIINNAVIQLSDGTSEGHNATFAYVMAESPNLSVDDESETIEGGFKVKLNSAEGEEPKLPDVILDPSLAAAVVYEEIGAAEGDMEDASTQNV
ncbi:phage tail protein [Salinicoccus sp. Marseille-QA3877]